MFLEIGGWKIKKGEEVVILPAEIKEYLEKFFAMVNTTARLVRLDMSPRGGIYEVELAPGGLMFWGALRGGSLPVEVINLARTALCLYSDWVEAYKYLCSLTGWKLATRWEEAATLVYYSGGPERLPHIVPREVFITDPWGGKIIPQGRPLTLEDDLRKLEEEFPQGFVLKPIDGWGSYNIYFSPPDGQGYNRRTRGHSWEDLGQVIEKAWIEVECGRATRWFVQPFLPPEEVKIGGEEYYRIWRVYAVFTAHGWTILGGLWNARPKKGQASLKIHGADDAIIGLVVT